MKKILLSVSRSLHESKRYNKIKSFVRDVLNNPHNPYKKYVDITIIFLIITSVFILIYEVKNPVPKWLDIYDIYIVSFVFSIEYLLRLWVHNDVSESIVKEHKESLFVAHDFSPYGVFKERFIEKLKYMLTPTALIDLLAIFPAYRPLRVLRIFVLFRVLKLLRYAKSINQFMEVLASKKFELLTLLFLLFFIVFTAGIAMYVLEESTNPNINSLFDAIYWAFVTISTVGYGDIAPVTIEGRSIAIMAIISGIAMISFATSVIVSAFSEKLSELKENRIIEEMNKNRSFLLICGYGQMTKMFLSQHKKKYTNYLILENDLAQVEEASKNGYEVIHEDASRYETLSKFNAEHSKITVLCLTKNDVENIYITLNAKSVSPKINVIARVNDKDMLSKFKHAGADNVLMPNEVANSMICISIKQPTMFKAIHAILTGKRVAAMDEIYANESIGVIGKSIKELAFKKVKLLFVGIQRGDEFIFNPPLSERVERDDILLVMGREISLDYFRSIYEGEVNVSK